MCYNFNSNGKHGTKVRPNHILLVILAVAIWGCNFIFVTLALQDVPPYLLCAIRFFLTAIPAVFFLPKPTIPFKHIFMYGLFAFALQFSCLFAGLYVGMPPGLASLIFQAQVFFSLIFAAFFLKEIPSPIQLIGAIISFTGLGLVWMKYTETSSWLGFILILAAAASMGLGNLFTRKLNHVPPLTLVAWGSLMALPLLIMSSLYIEGPDVIIHSLKHLSWPTCGSIFFIAYGSTWLAYGIWNNMLRLYSVAMVIPFALLVPFFGMISGNVFFNEPMQSWKLHAAWLIVGGLCINILGSRLIARHHRLRAKAAPMELQPSTLTEV